MYKKMTTLLEEKYFLGCVIGILLALFGLSLSEWRFLSSTFLAGPPVFFSITEQIIWSSVGFLVFLLGEIFFFSCLMLLLEKKKIVESWIAYMSKTVLLLVACLTLVQRTSGYTAFSTALADGSFYLFNGYTGLVQSVVLVSVFITLSLVLTADFLLRNRMVEKPGEKFYFRSGVVTVIFGLAMIFMVLYWIASSSFYVLPGIGYFYTQQTLAYTVDAFEIIGVYTLILGCVVTCFQKEPPLIKWHQVIGGTILTLVAFPLAFIPVQIWVERYILYSSILAPLDLGRIHAIFPLNFNLYTLISMILFTIGIIVYVQNSKYKTVTLIAFLIYIYFYPGLSRIVLSNYYIPITTPTVPILVYLSLAIVATVVSIPIITQKPGWDIRETIRKMLKPSTRATILLLVILALVTPILFLNSEVNSTPLTQSLVTPKSLTTEDKIDPHLLNISETQNVSVILRFKTSPVGYLEKLNSSPYNESFTFEKHNGEFAIYTQKTYYAIYGNVTAENNSYLIANLSRLVDDFNLAYVLWNEYPLVPPDIDFHYPYYFFVGADVLKAFNITGKGTTVAVVDSGVNDFNEEIRGRVIYQVNFLTGQEGDPRIVGELTPESPLRHGTGVAQQIAGVRGIAPEANIIDLKIKTGSEESFYMNCIYMAEAIDWCVRNKDRSNITVIALALGSRDQIYGFLTAAVDRAFLSGIVVIVAGGGYLDFTKNRIGGILLPGIADWGITVAATMGPENERWSPVSPIGPSPRWYLPKPELTGPGPYTSGSVPMVAGIALLLAQKCEEQGVPPILKAVVIRWSLIAGAQEYDLGSPGWDILYGFGRANALASYLFLINYLQI
ncbi:MAG: S8 family peptidase [Candidatus Jordarchaeum sp.]|uniref:S8 family peptidase n=1 Tax=Candidatus Jordarchaeum sp. TaxID=2823881 RepID=UPI00404A44AE